MSVDPARAHALFLELCGACPRQGPGSDASTRRALHGLGSLPSRPRVLDLGCGTGAQTLALAEALPTASFLAIDGHAPFLEALTQRAVARGFADRIDSRRADIGRLELEPGGFDLIWSEGAIYNVGFDAGLRAWHPLLRDGGAIAISEATWLVRDPPEEIAAYWREGYPAMRDVDGNLAAVRAAGFDPVEHFTLPASDWLREYYAPLEMAATQMASAAPLDADLAYVVDQLQLEMNLFRRHSDSFGYVFYVARDARTGAR